MYKRQLFDETNLAEISSPLFPGERLVVCRNPALAVERARKREDLLQATEAELEKVRSMVEGPRGSLRNADAGEIGERAGRVSNKYKVRKHFQLEIADGAFSFARKTEQIEAEATLDGLCVIRTTCPTSKLDSPAVVVRAYKQLKMAERAFRTMKDQIEIRPIHHHLENRVRVHAFLCMLAYYVEFHMRRRLAPILFDDHDRDAAAAERKSMVPSAQRSPAALRKAASRRTADGLPVHSFRSPIADLATHALNKVSLPSNRKHRFDLPTTPTPLQARAFELLGVSPGM